MLKKPLSGQVQLVIIATLFVLVPMLFIIVSFVAQYAQIGSVTGTVQLGKYVVRVADHLDRELSLTQNNLKSLSLSKELAAKISDPEALQRFLASAQKESPGFSRLEFYPNEQSLTGTESPAKRLFRTISSKGLPANTPLIKDSVDGKTTLIMGYPVVTADGRMLGVLTGYTDIDLILHKIKMRLGFSDALNLFLINSKGEALINLNGEPIRQLSQMIPPEEEKKVVGTNSGTFRYNHQNQSFAAGYFASRGIGQLSNPEVTILVSAPINVVEKSKTKPYFFLLFGAFAGIILLIYYAMTIKKSLFKKI